MAELVIEKPEPAAPTPTASTFSSWKAKLWGGDQKATVLYTGSSVATSVAQMIAGVALVRWILPQELGLWQSVNLALTYSFFVLAGVQNGLSRELPYYLGARDQQKAHLLAGTSLFYTLGGCLLALIAGLGALGALQYQHADVKVVLAVAAVTLLVIFTFYSNYLTVTFRSRRSFLDLAGVQTWQAALMLLTLPLIYFLRYDGMLLRIVIVTGTVMALMHRVRPIPVRPEWSGASFKLLLSTGIPIFLLDYMRSCAATVDRLVLLHSAGTKAVGFYALGLTVFNGFEVIPNSVSHYVYPRMSYQYGRDHDPRSLWRLVWRVALVLVGIMVPVACAGWFLLPPLIRAAFPKYVEGTQAAQILLLAAICSGGTVCVHALWSMKAWKMMTAYQVSFSVLLILGPILGLWLSPSPVTGVALGMLGARLANVAVGIGITYWATHPASLVAKIVP